MNKEGKIEEVKEEVQEKKVELPVREIVIETNGNDIRLVKAEVSGKIELIAIFQNLITFLNKQQ